VARNFLDYVTLCSLLLFAMGAVHADAPSIDACELLHPEQIEGAISVPVDAGVRNDSGLVLHGAYSSTCVWTIKEANPAPPDPSAPLMGKRFVILNVIQWPAGKDLARTFLDSFREAAAEGVLPRKPSPRDFGDEALWWGDGLAVRSADASFGVSVFMPAQSIAPYEGAREESLARSILQTLDRTRAVQDIGDLDK
jgi:hypothetical protein